MFDKQLYPKSDLLAVAGLIKKIIDNEGEILLDGVHIHYSEQHNWVIIASSKRKARILLKEVGGK